MKTSIEKKKSNVRTSETASKCTCSAVQSLCSVRTFVPLLLFNLNFFKSFIFYRKYQLNAKNISFRSQTTINSEFRTLSQNHISSVTNNYSSENEGLREGSNGHSSINVLADNCDQIPQFS